MGRDASPPPDDALEDVAYLSRSGNRLRILELLATEPRTAREIRELTDASRSTLRRILAELEERGWARRTTDGDFVATARGEHVVTAFTPLVGAMQAVRELGDAVAWIPTDEWPVELHHFRDATVRRSTPTSPVAAADYLADLLPGASTFRCLTHVAPPVDVSKAMLDGVETGRLDAEYVFTGELVEYLRDQPDRLARWQRYLQNDARVYGYAGRIPCNLWIVDDTVFLGNSHPDVDQACELIECTDEAVHSWARDVIEAYRTDADPLGVDAFADGPTMSTGRTE